MYLKCWVGVVLLGLAPSLGWAYSGGRGVFQDPFVLSRPDDLIQLSQTPSDYDKHFVMTKDIDLVGHLFTQPVIAPYHESHVHPFRDDRKFTGTLNGNGHVIRNVTISGQNNVGLFGVLSDRAQIFGLGIEDANIQGTGENVGMLAGHSAGRIRHCYASGTVSGVYQVGGLVGANYYGGSIENCIATGDVSGQDYVGGLVGYSTRSVVLNSYSTCQIRGEAGASAIGGLYGRSSGEAINSFWDTETSGISPDDPVMGTGLSTGQMQDQQTFLGAGWDFVGETENGLGEVWMMPEHGGYPVLSVFHGISPVLPFDHGTALGRCLMSDDPNEVMWNGADVLAVDWDDVALTEIARNQDRYPGHDPNESTVVISLSATVDILDASNLIGIDTGTAVVCQVLDEQGVAVPLTDPLSPFEPSFCWDILSQTLTQIGLQFQVDSAQAIPSRLSQVDFYMYLLESDFLETIEVPFEQMDDWVELIPGFEMIIETVTVEEGQWAYTIKERRTLDSSMEGILTPGTIHCEEIDVMEFHRHSFPLTDQDLIFNRRIVDSEGNLALRGNHNSHSGSGSQGERLDVFRSSGTGVHNIAAIQYVIATSPYTRIVPLTLTDIPVPGRN